MYSTTRTQNVYILPQFVLSRLVTQNVTCYINKALNTSSDVDGINILSHVIYIYIYFGAFVYA